MKKAFRNFHWAGKSVPERRPGLPLRYNSKTFPRLTLVLFICLFLLSFVPFFWGKGTFPGVYAAWSGKLLREGGVGGGTPIDAVVSETAVDLSATELGVLDVGVLEPESFSRPRILMYDTYTIEKGDMIGNLAARFGLNQDTLISVNNITNTRLLQIGQVLKVPNQDGVFYTVQKGDTLETIAQKFQAELTAIHTVNELFSDTIKSGEDLFIPGGRLEWINLQEINGELFIWPIPGYITSPYGYRISPLSGIRQFHSGLDIGSPLGTPVKAAMSGRVSAVGWDDVLGNFVLVSHHSGYRTLYAHLSVIRAKSGAYVGTGERIGDVGSTGLSTAPHLHFIVYKNGKTVNPRALMK